jgi:hypothetical protein
MAHYVNIFFRLKGNQNRKAVAADWAQNAPEQPQDSEYVGELLAPRIL